MKEKQIQTITELLKTMAHPIRLKILCLLLRDKELTVGAIRDQVKTTHANISQHLTILRSKGIVASRKDANCVYNRIGDARVNKLIAALQQLYCS